VVNSQRSEKKREIDSYLTVFARVVNGVRFGGGDPMPNAIIIYVVDWLSPNIFNMYVLHSNHLCHLSHHHAIETFLIRCQYTLHLVLTKDRTKGSKERVVP
jgi:hypothetical protein